MAQTAEQQTAVVLEWLEKHCPTGLKTTNGGLTSTDVEKISQLIARNHGDIWSIPALNDAVEKLHSNLTWFDSSPGAVIIRNRPVKERQLSEQAQREAGMRPNRLPSHTDDTKPISQRDLLQKIAKNILQTMPEEVRNYNPFKARAEAMVVQVRTPEQE